jgi:hypothetical protein
MYEEKSVMFWGKKFLVGLLASLVMVPLWASEVKKTKSPEIIHCVSVPSYLVKFLANNTFAMACLLLAVGSHHDYWELGKSAICHAFGAYLIKSYCKHLLSAHDQQTDTSGIDSIVSTLVYDTGSTAGQYIGHATTWLGNTFHGTSHNDAQSLVEQQEAAVEKMQDLES